MSLYGKIAVMASRECEQSAAGDPIASWVMAARQQSPGSISIARKSCPKCAFLTLCEIGVVKGVPRGNYTNSRKNKTCTLAAYGLLQREPQVGKNLPDWWNRATDRSGIKQNGQLEVILALHEAGRLLSTHP